ncbi:MAG: SDR family NAD(P)-dependent oxidoreductase [Rhodobiaceae bacterium]
MDLSQSSVLVTGGGSGLGRVLAADFAAAGAQVHICGRRREPLDAMASANPLITSHILDVTDEEATTRLFAEIGPQQVVIANAGIAESAPFHRTERDMWDRIIGVNLTGCFLTLRAGLRALRDSGSGGSGGGRLIAISSIMGLAGYRYASAYSASKHGVNGMVAALAAEIEGSGITANALCPGYLEGEMTDRTIATIMEKTGKSREGAVAVLAATSPEGRLIRPEEVSAAALRLCAPGSDGINGKAIEINGEA